MREAVSTLARDGGLNRIDAGGLSRARELEALGLLHMGLQSTLGTGFASAVKRLGETSPVASLRAERYESRARTAKPGSRSDYRDHVRRHAAPATGGEIGGSAGSVRSSGFMVTDRWRWLRSWTAPAWPLLQGTAAATVAWAIAKQLGGDHDPFFAPIAAFIGLNAPLGERGLNVLRLVLGVIVGIVVGELTLVSIGGGYVGLALATFVATLVARALGGTRIVIAQAAVGAILTIAVADDEPGVYRVLDAFIGAGVALVFSQVLFSPEPVALMRRAEAQALAVLAEALELAAGSLETEDPERADQAVSKLRDRPDQLVELSRVRRVSGRAARRSAVWRGQRTPVVRESENAGHLDLLWGSCLLLARAVQATSGSDRRPPASDVHDLARVVGDLAHATGDRVVRQRAADRALEVATRSAAGDAAALVAVRAVAADVMAFAGVDPADAADAIREGTGQFDIPTPPSAPRIPARLHRSRPGWVTAMTALGAKTYSALRRRRE
jgi:uncharacterized membrane protein YgaE (UPF0421/DUF939 family)